MRVCERVSLFHIKLPSHKALFLNVERTTSGVNLGAGVALLASGWWQEVARPGPGRPGSGHTGGSCTRAGPGESPAGPGRWYVINVTHRSSQLCSVTIDTFHQVRIKWCGKNWCLRVLSELRRACNSLCEQPELVVLAEFIFWSHAIGCQMSRPGWLLLLADWLSI